MSDEGASPAELLIEASRRNNTSLLEEILSASKSPSATAALINNTMNPTGLTPLHLAARNRSVEVLDMLLDQEDVETDPRTRRDSRTPLHLAVEHCNEDMTPQEWAMEGALAHVEMLLDAGCDPRLRDRHGLKAVDIADPRNTVLRGMLQRAEVGMGMGAAGDVVDEDAEDEDAGPPSDSD